MSKNLRLLAVASGALVVLILQSPTPRHGSLDHARSVYLLARSDAMLPQRAAAELARARQTLRQAERAWSADRDEAATRALALLAVRQIERARGLDTLQFGGGSDHGNPALPETSQREAALPEAGQREPASQRHTGGVRSSVFGTALQPQSTHR